MVPCLKLVRYMIAFRTSFEFIPPGRAQQLFVRNFLHFLYPFGGPMFDTRTDPVDSTYGTLLLVLLASGLDLCEFRKA